jgi:hypothetical protein
LAADISARQAAYEKKLFLLKTYGNAKRGLVSSIEL